MHIRVRKKAGSPPQKRKINLKKKSCAFIFFFFFRWPPSRNLTNRKLNYSSFLVLSLASQLVVAFLFTRRSQQRDPAPFVTSNRRRRRRVQSYRFASPFTTQQLNKTKQNKTQPKKSGDFLGVCHFLFCFRCGVYLLGGDKSDAPCSHSFISRAIIGRQMFFPSRNLG